MSTPEAVFKCLDNVALDEYGERRAKQEAQWKASCDQYKMALGNKELHGTAYYDGGWAIRGYVMEHTADLQEGWRRDGRKLLAVPAKRTEAGKALARELASLYLPGNHYPGAPTEFHTDRDHNGQAYMVFPRTELLGSQWWLTLSKAPDAPSLAQMSPDLWAPAKLSDYFAAKEASAVLL